MSISFGEMDKIQKLTINEESIISAPTVLYDHSVDNRLNTFYYKNYAPYISVYQSEVTPGMRFTLKVEYAGDGKYANLQIMGDNPLSKDLSILSLSGVTNTIYGFTGSIEQLKPKFTFRTNFTINTKGSGHTLYMIAYFEDPSSYMKVTLLNPALPNEGIDATLDDGLTWGTLYSEPMQLSILSDEMKTLILKIGSLTMRVDGVEEKLDTPPIVIEGRTVLPLKVIGDQLGASVEWTSNSQKITYTTDTVVIELWVGKKSAKVNGVDVLLDVEPFISNNRTLVPLKFVSENLGARVVWDPINKTVTITR